MNMNKIIVIPDSFKSSMTSIEVCDIMEEAINQVIPTCKVIKIPIADGGEGSIDAILTAVSGEKRYYEVQSPLHGKINSYIGLIDDRQTAIIEVAQSIGFIHKSKDMNPANTSSYSVGQLISKALDLNVKKIILCLGGSITNDGGCGLASCLGIRFLDEDNKQFIPRGESLINIKDIDYSNLDSRLSKTELIALVDVDNPLYGPNGAAYVYAGQKGADDKMVDILDKGLIHLNNIVKNKKMKDFSSVPGVGAAGGIGFGLTAFLNFKLTSGIDYFLKLVKLEENLRDADYVITGEGKFDQQSLNGKVISGIYKYSLKSKVPMIVVTGIKEDNLQTDFLVYEINKLKLPFEKVKQNAKIDLKKTMIEILSALNFK